MVFRRGKPDDALFKGLGIEARGPVPFLVIVVASVGLWALWNTYSPTLEKENQRLEKANSEVKQDLEAAKDDIKNVKEELKTAKSLSKRGSAHETDYKAR